MKTNYALFFMILICTKLFAGTGFTAYTANSVLLNPPSIGVKSIALDNNGKKIFCTLSNGLIIYDGLNFSSLNTSNCLIGTNNIYDIAIAANNHYWITTYSDGLREYDGINFTKYNTLNSLIGTNSPKKIVENNGIIYFASDSGLTKFSNGIFTKYTTLNSNLNHKTINDLCFDSSNNLWLATGNGLCKFDGTNFITIQQTLSTQGNSDVRAVFTKGNSVFILINTLGVFEYKNSLLKSIAETYDITNNFIVTFNQPTPRHFFANGPKGGVLFPYKTNRLIELSPNKIYYYSSTDTTTQFPFNFNAQSPITFDSSTNEVWIGTSQIIYKFKISEYSGFSIGNNGNNCKFLDINMARAGIMNRGDMFWNQDAVLPNYEIPKGKGANAIFANALWIGGIDVGSNLHTAAQTYRQTGNDFWPGPLDTISGNTDTSTYIQYDKIWKINRFDIVQFQYNFQNGNVQNGWLPTEDILTWPAHGNGNYTRCMAPFVDVNSNGIYDPLIGGDYPKIKGDQMLYWIFNDNFAHHTETGGLPLKVEIHASAYAYFCPEANDADSAINYTTYYNFKVYNRSNFAYNNCYIGNFTDYDLGNAIDDLMGCSKSYNLSYCYNADDNDETNIGYFHNPPMIGNEILNGPLASSNDGIDNDNDSIVDEVGEKCLMTSCIFYTNDFSPTGNPGSSNGSYNPLDHYLYLKAIWRDSTQLTYGGSGYDTSSIAYTNFMYSSAPPFDSLSFSNHVANDIRSLQGTGPFTFLPQTSFDYDFAIVFARDTVGAPKSQIFQQLFANATKAKNWFDNNSFPGCLQINSGIGNPKLEKKYLSNIYPNPSQKVITFRVENNVVVVSYSISDVIGNTVISLNNASSNTIDISALNDGVYCLTLNCSNGNQQKIKFIKR